MRESVVSFLCPHGEPKFDLISYSVDNPDEFSEVFSLWLSLQFVLEEFLGIH